MGPSQYDGIIKTAQEKYLTDVDWRLFKAQLYQESRLNPVAVSPAGAHGIAQFMPGTWGDVAKRLALRKGASPFDPEDAIPAAAFYMAQLRRSWSTPRPHVDRYCLALASYNAGFGNLLKAQKCSGGLTKYADIIRHLPEVTGHHSRETVNYVENIYQFFLEEVMQHEHVHSTH